MSTNPGTDLVLDLIRGALDASDDVHAFDDEQDGPDVQVVELVAELTGGRGEVRITVAGYGAPAERPSTPGERWHDGFAQTGCG